MRVLSAAPLVLYDGECGLCQGAVGWLAARDRRRRLRFAPLQGPTAAPHRAAAGPGLDTLVTVVQGPGGPRVLLRSEAVRAALRAVGGGWALLASLLAIVPRPLADALYRAVAARRHRLRAPRCDLSGSADGRFLP